MIGAILIAGLHVLVGGEWEKEQTVFESEHKLHVSSMYTNEKAPYFTHLLFFESKKSGDSSTNLYYASLDMKSQVRIKPHIIAEGGSTASVTGTEGDNRVYIAYTRVVSDSVVMFFIESKDGGSTWTKPVEIGNNKLLNRVYPNLISNKDNGRLYLFYIAYDLDKSLVAMISRPSDSIIFSKEVFIGETTMILQKLEATYTRTGRGGTVLHLQWSRVKKDFVDVVYSRSVTNGQTWSEPVVLFEDSFSTMYTLSSDHYATNPVLVSTTLVSKHSLLRKSLDCGKTWGDAIQFAEANLRDSAICGDTRQYLFLVGLNGMGSNVDFFSMDLAGNEIERGPNPFALKQNERFHRMPGVSCTSMDQSHIFIYAAASREHDGQSFLLVNRNSFTLE